MLKLQTHPSAAQHKPKRSTKTNRRTERVKAHFSFQMHVMHVLLCVGARKMHAEAELFLTEHGEDEILGRVDLERSLVVILALFVLAEFGDQPVELFYPGSGPEVQLGGVRDVFGAARGGGGATAS